MVTDPSRTTGLAEGDGQQTAPLAGTRSQSMQRLQIGLFGLATMVLLVGLANIVIDNARETDAGVVPEAAPTVAATDATEPAADPLADAGVVPEVPAETETQPVAPAPTQTIDVPDIAAP